MHGGQGPAGPPSSATNQERREITARRYKILAWKNLSNKEKKNHKRQPSKLHYIVSIYKCHGLSYDVI
jgi:hypothetical protein